MFASDYVLTVYANCVCLVAELLAIAVGAPSGVSAPSLLFRLYDSQGRICSIFIREVLQKTESSGVFGARHSHHGFFF